MGANRTSLGCAPPGLPASTSCAPGSALQQTEGCEGPHTAQISLICSVSTGGFESHLNCFPKLPPALGGSRFGEAKAQGRISLAALGVSQTLLLDQQKEKEEV